jgi:hypothetical protein
MTGRLKHGECTKGNEYNKQNKERGKIATSDLKYDRLEIVFSFSFLRPNMKCRKDEMFPQFCTIRERLFVGFCYKATNCDFLRMYEVFVSLKGCSKIVQKTAAVVEFLVVCLEK